MEQLEVEKLREEVEKLEIENDNATGIEGFVASYGGVLAGLAAIAGVVLTFRKQIDDQSRQRTLDREQQEKDREQRERERLNRREEKFASALEGLGSDSPSVQIGAATTLITFISDDDDHLLHEVRMAALANLKVDRPQTVKKVLVSVLQRASQEAPLESFERDLSRADLERIDLAGVDLSGGDLAFANLCGAEFAGANLFRAKGYEARLDRARMTKADLSEVRFHKISGEGTLFHETRLVMSHFKEASLPRAQFQRAKMQSSHFDGAKLVGAKFEEADLNDAYFLRAQFDEPALVSLTRAVNWQKAHFDADVRARLDELVRPAPGKESAGPDEGSPR
ncbi:MAG: pentapeptide repeat-containing protein [Actinomycetota bacterium]|nr:pentapeptide repeat-containing protein [Actinomycetota bacterium]